MVKLFGTSGIRGSVEALFTNQFCFDIGRSFSIFLQKNQQSGPVSVGLDPRSSSPRILSSLTKGLFYEQRSIVNQGAVPVPAMNYILKTSSYAGSIMVTGSHISSNLNGLKFFAFREEILKNHEKEITEIYESLKNEVLFVDKEILVKDEDRAKQEYQEMLITLAKNKIPKLNKVIVDPGNGAQSDVMPQVLTRLGLNVVEVNSSIQQDFISRDTEVEDVLKDLQQIVLKEKADLGIAYDYDGDRVVFVDEKGNFIPGDYSGTLVAMFSPSPTIVTPINTSQVVDHINKKIIRTKVGSPYVVAAMKENSADFGFEANGGGISAEVMMSRDGGSTTIKILKILEQTKKSLSSLIGQLPQFFLFREKIDCPSQLNEKILSLAKEKFKNNRLEEIDGLKIWIDKSSWLLFRPSSNAPEFRVFAESENSEKVKSIGQEAMSFVKSSIKSLQ